MAHPRVGALDPRLVLHPETPIEYTVADAMKLDRAAQGVQRLERWAMAGLASMTAIGCAILGVLVALHI